MNCIKGRIVPAVLILGPVLTFAAPVQAQNSVTASARPAISVLDSTKEQDGLVGSVRRVKTETARIELKEGRAVEGPPQLVEITTYGIRGNRVENTSYPIAGSLVGKEEYKYDQRGNIVEMTLRDDRGAILSREAYNYEFDKFGNWTKMTTSLVVFENGELKREPVEVTYRTVTYYFDDTVAKAVEEPKVEKVIEQPAPAPAPVNMAESVPQPTINQPRDSEALSVNYSAAPVSNPSPNFSENPPSLVFTPPPPPAEKQANDLYLTGRGQFDAGDFKGAVNSYLESIKLEPKSAEVFLNLGHAYLKLEKNADAFKAFKQSAKLNPDNAETQYGLGVSAYRSTRYKDSADAFKKATTLNPRMAKAHYGLALADQELGQTSGVLEQYRILETLDKSLAKKLAQTFPQFNFSCRAIQGCP
jgi:tetratricopeptide (TPR) repeat protein